MSTALEPVNTNHQIAPRDPLADASPEWRQTLREAEKLAVATLTPDHLKVAMPPYREGDENNNAKRKAAWNQTVANCILVANQAHKWNADVFAVAAESYVVGNKLGYQGKLIAAVVNARGKLTTPLRAIHSNMKGDEFAAVVYGSKTVDLQSLNKEEKKEIFALLIRYADKDDQEANRELAMADVLAVRVSVGQCKTLNKEGKVNAQWTKDPEQKLVYTGTTKWARRYTPELMVGILSDDDIDRMKSEQHIEHSAEQRRISALIPASLDTTSFGVPDDNPEFQPETKTTEQEQQPETFEEVPKQELTVAEIAAANDLRTEPAMGDTWTEAECTEWTTEFIALVPQLTKAKHRREYLETLDGKRKQIGEANYARCAASVKDAGWPA